MVLLFINIYYLFLCILNSHNMVKISNLNRIESGKALKKAYKIKY